MFRYGEYYAENRFSLFIKKIWVLDNLSNPGNIEGRSVLPNGCFNIAVIEGLGLRISHMGQEKHLGPGSYFCGQMTQAVGVEILPRSKATMVQLHPWTPAHFTGEDMGAFTDQVVPLAHLKYVPELKHPLSGQDPRAIYQATVLAYAPLLRFGKVPGLLCRAGVLILDTKGSQSVAGLAATLGCSARHLQKIFSKHVGLTPKQLCLIVRLRSAVDGIACPQEGNLSLTELAIDNNFYDQAHFINAFRAFARTSPKRIFIPDYFLSLKK